MQPGVCGGHIGEMGQQQMDIVAKLGGLQRKREEKKTQSKGSEFA